VSPKPLLNRKNRRRVRKGAERVRDAAGQAWEETGPHRDWAVREARRQAPRLLALALSTALEMRRANREPPTPRQVRRRRRRGSRILALIVLAGGTAVLVRVFGKRG